MVVPSVYEVQTTDIDRQLAALRQIALRLGRFLAVSKDPHELCGLLVPDYERFHWSNPVTRARGAEIYGF